MTCVCVWLGTVWVKRVDEGIGFRLHQSYEDRGSVGHVSEFWSWWGVGFDQCRERWCLWESGFSV